jgi:hypothetical protein
MINFKKTIFIEWVIIIQSETYIIVIIEDCSILRILVNITIMMAFRYLDEANLLDILTFYPFSNEKSISRFR